MCHSSGGSYDLLDALGVTGMAKHRKQSYKTLQQWHNTSQGSAEIISQVYFDESE